VPDAPQLAEPPCLHIARAAVDVMMLQPHDYAAIAIAW
jgi:hypothetical protein